MEFERSEVILNTENYDACVAFYRDVFDLPVMFETRDGNFRLICLDLGGSYLMIETEGVARPRGKTMAESATKLRFNVADIEAAPGGARDRGQGRAPSLGRHHQPGRPRRQPDRHPRRTRLPRAGRRVRGRAVIPVFSVSLGGFSSD